MKGTKHISDLITTKGQILVGRINIIEEIVSAQNMLRADFLYQDIGRGDEPLLGGNVNFCGSDISASII